MNEVIIFPKRLLAALAILTLIAGLALLGVSACSGRDPLRSGDQVRERLDSARRPLRPVQIERSQQADRVSAGEGLQPLGRLPSLPVSRELLGHVVDPLGRPLDDRPAPAGVERPVLRDAPHWTERAPVDRPLFTGVMVIDAAILIGRGQWQLIVGDRNVGKTALALDIVSAQRSGDVACFYVVVGQPISRVLSILRETPLAANSGSAGDWTRAGRGVMGGAYDELAWRLAELFRENFRHFESEVSSAIASAGAPAVRGGAS